MIEIEDISNELIPLIQDFQQENPNWIVMIRGATATGKSKLSINIAKKIPSEIISADSRQIFKFMNIWTDKIPQSIRDQIPHHQIDIIDPDQNYTAWQRKENTVKLVWEIQSRGKLPIIVWWTWLYIDTIYKNFSMPTSAPDKEFREKMFSLEESNPGSVHAQLQKIDPEEASKLHPKSIRYIVRALEIFHTTGKTKTEWFFQQAVQRPILMVGLRREKEETNKLINTRIKEMFKNWLIEEVKWLLELWYSETLQSMQWIWYKEVVEYIKWNYDKKKCEEMIKKNTHHLAKKQRTRFRRYIAEGKAMPKDNIIYKTYFL